MKTFQNVKTTAVILLIFSLGIFGVYNSYKYNQIKNELAIYKEDPQAAEAKQIISQISDLVDIPANEIPELMTIRNKDELKDDSFFEYAQNGDKVLVYSSKKILFRPSTGKVIETQNILAKNNEPVNVKQATSSTSSTDSQKVGQAVAELENLENIAGAKESTDKVEKIETPIRLAIINGTQEFVGITAKTESYLRTVINNYPFSVVSRTDSVGSYEKTIVVINKTVPKNFSDALIEVFNGSVESLPSNEKILDADIMLFIGKDFARNNSTKLGL